MAEPSKKSYYGKRPLWQWILIYVVIGAIVYGLIYYFVLAKKGVINYGSTPAPSTPTTQSAPNVTTTPSSNQGSPSY